MTSDNQSNFSLYPLTLSFKNSDLEIKYQETRAQSLQLNIPLKSIFIGTIIISSINAFVVVLRKIRASDSCTILQEQALMLFFILAAIGLEVFVSRNERLNRLKTVPTYIVMNSLLVYTSFNKDTERPSISSFNIL